MSYRVTETAENLEKRLFSKVKLAKDLIYPRELLVINEELEKL